MLVAVSGGPDSAALLHVLGRLDGLRLELHAASVDHRLREGSQRDVAVAAELAARLEVPFHALGVEVRGQGASVQAHARDARYAALHRLANELGASALAVGHTLDDQAETVLSRLLRGAAITGLAGIAPRREDGVVRPLIDCRRDAVRSHVTRFELPHVTDPSNEDPRFERVRLREAVLPALREEDDNVVPHLAAIADEARELRAWLDAEASGVLSARQTPEVLELRGPPPVRARSMVRWVEELTGRPAKRAYLRGLQRGDETLLSGDWVVRREGDRLEASRQPERVTRGRAHEE